MLYFFYIKNFSDYYLLMDSEENFSNSQSSINNEEIDEPSSPENNKIPETSPLKHKLDTKYETRFNKKTRLTPQIFFTQNNTFKNYFVYDQNFHFHTNTINNNAELTENSKQIRPNTNLEPVDYSNHFGTRMPVHLHNGFEPMYCKNKVDIPFSHGANCTSTSKDLRVGGDSPTSSERDVFTHLDLIDLIDLSKSDEELDAATHVDSLYSNNSHVNYKISDNFKNESSCKNTSQPRLTVIEKPPYFANLMEIFPNDDKNILLELSVGNEDLNVAIEKVLYYKERANHINEVPVENISQCKKDGTEQKGNDELYKKQFTALQEILVDADPIYLENTFKNELQGDQDKIDAFVIEVLDKRNIPTAKQYQDRLKKEEQHALYTTNFSVETFLKDIPEPFNYFTEVNNGSTYKDISLEYLKQRYCKISVKCIREKMVKNKNNLTVTYKELSKTRSNLSGKRTSISTLHHTMASLKEVCFIEHQEEIMKYLKNKDDQKQDAFLKAKECGELFECSCCFDDEVIIEEIATCTDGHIFCKTCVRKGVETKLGEGVNKFSCLTDCDGEFDLQTLESVLSTQLFTKIMLQKQSEEIKAANIPEIEDCPFCEYMGIPIAESIVFTCLNPECAKESCRKCHAESHIPLRCNEVEQKEDVSIRTYIEGKMTEALIRKCYKCEKEYIKESGCNKITCTCGALQCYICRKPVKDYSHFNPDKGPEIHKCPLYSTNKALHIDAVKAAAEAVKGTLSPNITLKHDPTKFLPE